MRLLQHPIDAANTSGAVSLVSAASGVTMFGLNMSEVGVLVSALVAVVSCGLHVWYTLRKDKRAKEIHAARLRTGDLDGQPE